MERIEFKDLDIYNFMCFKDTSLHLNSKGLHFVYGEVEGQLADSNGAGKSAWVEALSWCLFGKTLRDMKADDVVNSSVLKDCSVVLLFEKGANTYIVHRSRKSTENGNDVSFSSGAGGDDLSGATNDETNKRIETVLGFSFDLFKNTICHGQGLPYRFTQATDAEKKEIFDEILNLGWMQDAKKRTTELSKRYLEVVNEEKLQQVGLQEKLLLQEEALKTLEEQKKVLKIPGTTGLEDLDHVNTLTQRQAELLDKVMARNRKLEKVRELLKKSEGKSAALVTPMAVAEGSVASLREKVRTAEENIKQVKKELSSIKELLGKPCPICDRSIGKENMESVSRHLKKEFGVWSTKQMRFNNELAEVEEQYKELCSKNSKLIDKLDVLKGQRDSLELDNEANNREVASLDVELGIFKGRAESRELSHKEQLGGISSQIEQGIRKKKQTSSQIKESEEMVKYTEKLLKIVEFWVEGFGNRGIRSLILDNVIPFLNTKAQEYSEVLTNGEYKIDFCAQSETARGEVREKFVVDVRKRDDGVLYNAFSGGEKRRIDVIVLLALHDLITFQSGIDANIQIFDEVVESLDETGIQKLMGILTERAETRGIYIISHNSDLDAQFDYSIRVVKNEDGDSEIIAQQTV